MNEQEAIKAIRLDGIQMEGKAVRMLEFYKGLVIAEEALEKQIPKKPVLHDGFMTVARCSVCNEVLPLLVKHCNECGNAIDWTVEE